VSALCMPLFDSPRATIDFLCPLVSYPIRSISRSIEIDPFIDAMFSRVANKQRNLIFRSRTLRRADQTCEKIKIPVLLCEKFQITRSRNARAGTVKTFVNSSTIVADTDRDDKLCSTRKKRFYAELFKKTKKKALVKKKYRSENNFIRLSK